jgi:MOSC domain-containing protein
MNLGVVQQIWRHPVKSMAGERLDECTVGRLGIPGDRGWALRDETNGEITNGKRIPLLMQCAASYREEPGEENIPPVEITFPDGTRAGSNEPNVNARLSEVLGKDVTLWPLQPATDRNHYRRKSATARIIGPLSQSRSFRSMLPKLTKLPSLAVPLREMFSREAGESIPDISVLPPEILEFTSPPGTYFDAFPIHVLTRASLEAMSQLNPTAVWDVRRFRPNFFVDTNDEIDGLAEAAWSGRALRLGTVELRCEIPTVRCGMPGQAQKGLPKDPSVLRSIVKDAEQNLGIYANVIKPGRVAIGDRVELI